MRACLLAATFACLLAPAAFAQDPKPADDPNKPATVKDVAEVKAAAKAADDNAHKYADIAWVLVSTALVMVMLPGLALFYGGMARRKNVLGTMMHTMICLGLVGVQWVAFGYSLAFGESQKKLAVSKDAEGKPVEASLIGYSKELLFLGEAAAVPVKLDDELAAKGIKPADATDEQKAETQKAVDKKNRFNTFPNTKLPLYLHASFQGMFAIITVALISGAFAERVKFGAYLLFALIWTTVVYDPIAHWVWAVDWVRPAEAKADDPFPAAGLLGANGAIDFAGGTVVHVAAGFSGLAAILLLRKRIGYGKQPFHPNSMVLTLVGGGLLWFGWFGFNGGSALMANGQAVSALAVTQVAAATAGLAWVLVEWLHKGKPTALGFASGLVTGLVAITPASGFVPPVGAMAIGALAGLVCYAAVLAKSWLGYDDSLDAFGIHGLGGFLGAVLTGVFVSLPLWASGTESDPKLFPGKLNAAKTGIDYMNQVNWQVAAAVVSAVYAFLATAVLVLVIDKTIGFTLKPADEAAGLDLSQHGETGFDMGPDVDAGAAAEPKAATAPPPPAAGTAARFTVILDGADPDRVREVWAGLCRPVADPAKPRPEFAEVYRHLTTLRGNRFRFKGGNPHAVMDALKTLFLDELNQPGLSVHVERG